ncbi:MAG: hypothetical protein ACK4UO_12780 [Pseudolabrys sp.]
MRFEAHRQGPADVCGANCRLLISASGAITADTPREFLNFMQGRNLAGATLVLDSDGGSVHGAIALGREVRRLGLATTVGRAIGVPSAADESRVTLSPHADCESMCAFVLIAGIQRTVPEGARVMVHQIWLGDRREDPTAASYSAEDLVLVQRDVGRLALYTAEMGAAIDLLDLSLRIPPWEPMHALTRDELVRMKVVTAVPATAATVATSRAPAAAPPPTPRVTDRLRPTPISEQRWAMIDRSGAAALARRHPLTVEGESIGSFDLIVACGASPESYDVSYVERRRDGEQTAMPVALGKVTLRAGGRSTALKVVTSERRIPGELSTFAAGPVPAGLIDGFAATGNRSLTIETESVGMITAIRIGNTGAKQALPRLAAGCVKPAVERAELAAPKTGGFAAAR